MAVGILVEKSSRALIHGTPSAGLKFHKGLSPLFLCDLPHQLRRALGGVGATQQVGP